MRVNECVVRGKRRAERVVKTSEHNLHCFGQLCACSGSLERAEKAFIILTHISGFVERVPNVTEIHDVYAIWRS